MTTKWSDSGTWRLSNARLFPLKIRLMAALGGDAYNKSSPGSSEWRMGQIWRGVCWGMKWGESEASGTRGREATTATEPAESIRAYSRVVTKRKASNSKSEGLHRSGRGVAGSRRC